MVIFIINYLLCCSITSGVAAKIIGFYRTEQTTLRRRKMR